MTEVMKFVGREKEIAYINSLIEKADIQSVIFVRGAGGLGKTRLLQEIQAIYVDKSDFLVSDIIDFDDRSLRTFEGLEIRIARELGIAAEVAKEVQELRRIRSSGAIKRMIDIQQQVIAGILKNRFDEISKTRRVLLFFDTTEKFDEANFKSLLSLLSSFASGVFIFAGRPRPEVGISELMNTQFGKDAYIVNISPLDREKSTEYLRAKLRALRIALTDEVIQNLLIMVEGKPILIELATQWLSIAPPPDWLVEELQSVSGKDFEKKKSEFAVNLVRHITQLRTPIDRLLLIMSRVYPFDSELAEELLGLTSDEAEILLKNARQYVFVKSLPEAKLTLHDEMREMVNRIVWPLIDITGVRRRRDSRRAAAIFERKVNRLAGNQKADEALILNTQYREQQVIAQQAFVEQWVEHALFADISSGNEVLNRAWAQAIEEKDYEFAERVLEIAKPYYDDFSADQQFDYTLLAARLNNYWGRVEESIKTLRSLVRLYSQEPRYLSGIYNALGIAERISGNLKDSARYLTKNLEIIETTNPSRVPYVANQLGYTFRLMGDLRRAENRYKHALDLAMEAEVHDRDLIASILNNLGYIYGVQKKYDLAENFCLQAADIWNAIGLPSEVGRVDTSLGIIYRDRGNYDVAIKLLDQAVVRVSRSQNFENIGRAHFHLAWAKWFQWEEINQIAILEWEETKEAEFIDMELLEDAKIEFDTSLDVAENHGASQLLPGILHQMSNVYWWLGWLLDKDFKLKARELNARAYHESERRNNIRYWIDSLVGEAEYDYDANEYDKIPGYSKTLQARYGKREEDYSLYFGRMIRILGDVAFIRGQYDDARMHYINALPKIQKHGGFGKYSTRSELLRLERKLDKLSTSEVDMWLRHFQEHWKGKSELLNWCNKERYRAKLRAN